MIWKNGTQFEYSNMSRHSVRFKARVPVHLHFPPESVYCTAVFTWS
jgi:hypothetical protein